MCIIIYLWYKEYTKDCCDEYVNQATKNCSVSIQEVAQQYGTDNHDENDDRGEIDDHNDILCVVENLNLYFSRLDGKKHSDQLSEEQVEIQNDNPD